jgi:IclR family transcriptional regulator, pca regulon regulatory protein
MSARQGPSEENDTPWEGPSRSDTGMERRGEAPRDDARPTASRQSISEKRMGASVSLRHGLAILGLFSSERPWLHMGEIADAIGLSPFDTHLQVTAMRRMNFIQEGAERRYGLGSGPPDPTVAIRAMGIVRHTRAHLIALQRLVQCPVTLAMLNGTELVVVDRAVAPSSPRLEMTIDLYRRLPAHATALGKVLLAYLPEHREQSVVEEMTLEALTPFTITDRRRLLEDLQHVRSRALALEDREHLPHRRCIAAPVRGAHNRVIAAVGITIVDPDTPLEQLVDRHSARVGAAAWRLSDALRHARLDESDLDWPRP